MGTSSSSGGPRPTTPLEPTWIINSGTGNESNNDGGDENEKESGGGDEREEQEDQKKSPNESVEVPKNRYRQPRSDFRRYTQNREGSSLNNALRGYVKNSGGGSSTLSRRLRPSGTRVALFYSALSNFQTKGESQYLQEINLSDYSGKPLLDVLGALTDEIFKTTDNVFDNTQDDSITKQAYVNTINRIVVEIQDVDLDKLSQENVETMVAIFIEETISNRVICDIGASLTKITDPSEILKIENEVSQIVSGYVRNTITPQIRALGMPGRDLEKQIENIYRIAFDAITGSDN